MKLILSRDALFQNTSRNLFFPLNALCLLFDLTFSMRCAWARRVMYGYNPRIYGAGARCRGPSTCPTTVLCRAGSHMTAGRCDMAARSSDLGRAKTTTAIEKTNKLVH